MKLSTNQVFAFYGGLFNLLNMNLNTQINPLFADTQINPLFADTNPTPFLHAKQSHELAEYSELCRVANNKKPAAMVYNLETMLMQPVM